MIFLPKINDIFWGGKNIIKHIFFAKNIIKNTMIFGLKYHLSILFCFDKNLFFMIFP